MKRTGLILIVLSLLASELFALTWTEARSQASKGNSEIISAKNQVESSRWSYYRSLSPFLPQISASLALADTPSSSYGLNATQSLFSGLEHYFGAASARASYDYYSAVAKKTEADIYYQARSSFIDLLAGQENIALNATILSRRKDNADMIELRYENGREDHGVMLRTRAEQNDAEYSLASARRELALSKLKLSQLLSSEVQSAEGPMDVGLAAAPDYQKLLAASPAYSMAQKQFEQSDLAYQQTISGFLPSVSLSGSYRKSGTNWPPESSSKTLSLNVSYALFPGGSNIADRFSYAAKLDKARQDLRQSLYDLRYALEAAYASFKDAAEALKVAKVFLAALAERAEIARAKYLNGMLSYDEWSRIENDFITAQKSLLSKKKTALLSEAAWYNAYGGFVK